MSEKDGGPAFPESHPLHPQPGSGMSLRDYFAAKAMEGFAAKAMEGFAANSWSTRNATSMAKEAYAWADAMLKVLDMDVSLFDEAEAAKARPEEV